MKIFDKGLILPPRLNFDSTFIEDRQYGFDDVDDDDYVDDHDVDVHDDDDDASPVVIAGPGKTQAFAVYIYIYIYVINFNIKLCRSHQWFESIICRSFPGKKHGLP